MSSLALPAAFAPRPLLGELFERQRSLALFGLATLLLALPVAALQAVDPRTLHSVSVWVKPAKFFLSTAAFSLTAAWFWGYVEQKHRQSRRLKRTAAVLIGAASFELLYITLQAARGLDSHFNLSSPVYALLYGLMGVAAVLLVGTTLPLAWEIARRPRAGLRPDLVAAVVIGLVLTFLLGGGFGGYMGSGTGHNVGAEGGRLFFFGWNRGGGDLRIAHFLGIHAEQAIPLIAASVAGLGAAWRWTALAAGTFLYVALAVAVFLQAVAGRALLPL